MLSSGLDRSELSFLTRWCVYQKCFTLLAHSGTAIWFEHLHFARVMPVEDLVCDCLIIQHLTFNGVSNVAPLIMKPSFLCAVCLSFLALLLYWHILRVCLTSFKAKNVNQKQVRTGWLGCTFPPKALDCSSLAHTIKFALSFTYHTRQPNKKSGNIWLLSACLNCYLF